MESFDERLRRIADEITQSLPTGHPQMTPSCLSIHQIGEYVTADGQLSTSEVEHLIDCPYCSEISYRFAPQDEQLVSLEEIEELLRDIDASLLPQDQICEAAAEVLTMILPQSQVDPEDLRLNFRVGVETDTLFRFEVTDASPQGIGIGSAGLETTTTVALNLAALFTAIKSVHPNALNDRRIYEVTKEYLGTLGSGMRLVVELIRKKVSDQ